MDRDDIIKRMQDDMRSMRCFSPEGITTTLGATGFDEDRSDILGQNGNDGLHYMTPEEQELPAEERHDCDRCGGSWWSPHNTECPCQSIRSDGSTASYYELPEGATELQDLISYRNMNHFDAMLFILCYDHPFAKSDSERLRIAREMVHYASREVCRLQGMHTVRENKAP